MIRGKKHKRTMATSISPAVREAVEQRDGGRCIFCKMPGRGEAHFISRAQGGIGSEENIITVCRGCHDRMDNSQARPLMLKIAEAYLREHYPEWDKENLIYKKYSF